MGQPWQEWPQSVVAQAKGHPVCWHKDPHLPPLCTLFPLCPCGM